MTQNTGNRLYFIDNARGIASIMGVFFHVGLMLNTHQASADQTIDFSYYIRYFNVIRMPLFLFIAGYFTYYSLRKYSTRQYLFKRFERIGIPLFFGIFLILPINTFLKKILVAKSTGVVFEWEYLDFIREFKWDHIWFLFHISLFSFITVAAYLLVKRRSYLSNLVNRFFVFLFSNIFLSVILFSLMKIVARKFGTILETLLSGFLNAEVLMLPGMFNNFFVFLLGLMAFKFKDVFFANILSAKRKDILILALSYVVAIVIDLTVDFRGDNILFQIIKISLLLLALNMSRAYLNFSNKLFSYISNASYPFYLLHFPMSLLVVYLYFVLSITTTFVFVDYLILCIITTLSTYFVYSFFINSNMVGRFIISGILPKKEELQLIRTKLLKSLLLRAE